MRFSTRYPHWHRLRWPAIASLGVALVIGSAWAAGWRYNNTPSEPMGLYHMTPITDHSVIRRGELISFCPSIPLYPFLDRGVCPNGGAPFLKTVVGLPGDVVVVSAAGVTINGRALPESRPLAHPRGYPQIALPAAYGVHRLQEGEYWVYGSADPKMSFDSRYWGPVKRASIIGILTRFGGQP